MNVGRVIAAGFVTQEVQELCQTYKSRWVEKRQGVIAVANSGMKFGEGYFSVAGGAKRPMLRSISTLVYVRVADRGDFRVASGEAGWVSFSGVGRSTLKRAT